MPVSTPTASSAAAPAPAVRLAPAIGSLILLRGAMDAAYRAPLPFLIYIAAAFGADPAQAGWLAVALSAAGLVAPVIGVLEGWLGRRMTTILAAGGFIAACGLMPFAPSFSSVLVLYLAVGVTKALFTPQTQAFVGEAVPYERRGAAIGFVELSWALGWIIGVPVFGFLIERATWWAPFIAFGLAGLFCGPVEEAWSKAADLSARLHIRYVDRPFHTVLSCAPPMYDDLWVGGKCMYKLEPVVADGGRLIIYAPHITEVSHTHGAILDEIGYHVRDYFVRQWDRFRNYPWGVLAHSTHVKGIGTFEDGVERPRIEVILATGIPQERCRRINLGYMDPATVRVEEYRNREDEGILYVPKAGETLYRLKAGESAPGGTR